MAKKLITIILMLISLGCAKQNHNQETKSYKKFRDYISLLDTLETDKVLTLKKCAKKNIYCKSMLGNMYYYMGQYDKAFELLVDSQGDLKGSQGYRWAPSELALGEMYFLSHGVKKNQSEAKAHIIKCALAGNNQCISWMISFETIEFNNEKQNIIEHPEFKLEYYAARQLLYWYTVEQFVSGNLITGMTDDGKILHISNKIDELRKILGKKITMEWQENALELVQKFDAIDNYTRNITITNIPKYF